MYTVILPGNKWKIEHEIKIHDGDTIKIDGNIVTVDGITIEFEDKVKLKKNE